MRNVLLGTIAILISSSIVMARPVQKSNMSLKSLVEFKINQKNNLKLSPLNEDDDENHNLPPIRTGKVKYTISKGTFGNTA